MRSGDIIDGRFVVEKLVARGGMGDIYRARDSSTGRPIALKMIPATWPWADDERLTGRLRNEARALVELTHPAVVRYVAHGASPEHGHYLAMEWLDGITLWERLQATALDLDESLTLGARVADGLGLAHARGMVHRDVKPLNLLLVGGRVDQVKILDFGIVRLGARQHITATGAGIGTPEYMAPEQARGERGVGPPADVFSLGCVLYKCLTGQAAFRGDHVAAILAKLAMLVRPPRVSELRPEIPQVVDDLVARMMSPRASERPADGAAAAALVRDVQQQLTEQGSLTRPRPSVSLTRRERRPLSVLYIELGFHADRTAAAAFAPTDPALVLPMLTEEPVPRGPSDTWLLVPAVRQAVEPYGARVEPLLDGSLVAVLTGGAAMTDLVVRSARCALALRAVLPGASIGVATLQAELHDAAALAEVIDVAVTRVRPASRTIRIDRRTETLLPDRFEVRGDDEGGFELLGEGDRAGDGGRNAPRRLLGRATPFVGRNRTLRQLLALYQGCVEDRAAQAVVIVGEAGIGKSRLRAELLAALAAGHTAPPILFARGDPLRSGLPFGALERALLALLAPGEASPEARRQAITAAAALRLPPEEARRVAEFIGEICAVGFPADDSPPLRAARQDPALMADQRRRAFEDWLLGECAAQPMVIIVEDLHWVDHATIELLASSLRRARDLPLLLVALARHEAKDRFPRLAEEWERQEIRLEPLRPADCADLVRTALAELADEELVRRLVDRSAGNPFFLEELIRAAAAGESSMLPDTVLGSVQLRLARLEEPARQALRAASIFGAVFRASAVAALLGRDTTESDAERTLDQLVDEELLHRLDAQSYAFRHDLLRESAYAMLTDADRLVGHRLAGEWLLAAGESDPVVLAEHFARGGATEQAMEWFQRAAEEALGGAAPDAAESLRKAATHFRRAAEVCAATYANENAIAFYDRAIALWTTLDTTEAGRTRLACARLCERAGQRERALAELQRAEEEAEKAGDVVTRVEALLARSDGEKRSSALGAIDRAWHLAERARDLAQSVAARELEAKALTALASVLLAQGTEESSQKSVQLARLAISITTEHGDLATRLWRLGNAFLIRNDLDRAAVLYRDALALSERSNDEILTAGCRANGGMVQFRRWHLDAAIEETQRALAIYQRVGHRVRISEMKINLGFFWVKRGHHAPAESYLRDVLGGAGSDWIVTTTSLDSLAQLERSRGNESAAQIHLTEAARVCEEVGVPGKQGLYLGMLAESQWVSGQTAAAIASLSRAASVTDGATLSHALVLAQLGALEQAAELLDQFRDADPDPDRKAAARLALARVLCWQEDASGARARCVEALDVLAPTPLPQHVLPAEALMAVLDGQPTVAVSALRAARVHCSGAQADEVAVDVGEFLIAMKERAPNELVRSFLEVASSGHHHGVRHRIQHVRSRLLAALGDVEGSRACASDARAQVAELAGQLDGDFAETFLQSRWVTAILGEKGALR